MTQHPIFLIVLDSLRADRAPPVSAEFMPNLESFAQDSFIFSNAYATGSWTVPSHASIFTGEYPSIHGSTGRSKRFSPVNQPLATKVANQGYSTELISANPWISPNFGFDKGFQEVEYIDNKVSQLPFTEEGRPTLEHSLSDPVQEIVPELLGWISKGNPLKRSVNCAYQYLSDMKPYAEAEAVTNTILSRDDDFDNSFIFANYMDAHEPYHGNLDIEWNLRSMTSPPPEQPQKVIERYNTSCEDLDYYLGELFTGLKNRDVFNDSLIILVGDHGQALGESDYWGHGSLLLESLINVPLLIRPPFGSDRTLIEESWSLRRLFNLIYTVSGSNEFCIEKLIRDTVEPIVVSESAGPHMDVEVPENRISPEGYRAYRGDDFQALEDLATGELASVEGGNSYVPKREIQDFRSTLGLKDGFKHSNMELDQSTENRLQDLGYI